MSLYLLLADIHAADKAPASCTESYMDDLMDLIMQTGRVARRREAAAVVWAGDVFHAKAPNRTSHRLVQAMIGALRSYPCPVFIVPGNHDLCVSDDTEALTSRGWLRRDQLDGTELFATLNPGTHEFEWQAPRRLHVSSFIGDLVHFNGARVDHLVTPNHDVYVTTPQGSTSRRADGTMPPPRSVPFSPETMRKRKASDAPGYPQRWYGLTAAPKWYGKHLGFVEVPPTTRAPGLRLSERDAARLFGWYVSEGSSEPWRVALSQSRSASPGNYEEIAALVVRLGFVPQLAAKTVRIGSAVLSEFLSREFGRVSREKRLPEWVKNWPRELLALLLETALKGDGTRNGHSSWTYTSNSERLVDDLQEVCVRLGVRSIKSGPIPTIHRDYPGSPGTMFRLGISYGAPASLPVPHRVRYSGTVWCPELANGLWMTRRNGRTLWTGNSHDRLASIRETQPLGVLFEAGAATRLEGWGGYDERTQYFIYGVPWLQGYGNWGAYDGEDPHPPIELNLAKALEGWRYEVFEAGTGSARPLVVTHAPLYPPGRELEWEHFPAARWAEAMGGAGAVFYGHVHPCHGIYEAGGVTFCNMGALSRGSLTESDLTRDVYCTLYDDQTGEFEPVKLNAKPADQVFRLKEKQQVTDMQGRLDEFLSSVSATSLAVISVESVISHIRGMRLGPEVEALAEELLTEAQHAKR